MTPDKNFWQGRRVRLHEKLGFCLEGTLRRMVFTQGQYYDLLWFGMTREEFEAGLGKPRV